MVLDIRGFKRKVKEKHVTVFVKRCHEQSEVKVESP